MQEEANKTLSPEVEVEGSQGLPDVPATAAGHVGGAANKGGLRG